MAEELVTFFLDREIRAEDATVEDLWQLFF
jgi:hypothetical protein